MNKISLLLIVLVITANLTAQERIKFINIAPDIDGFTDDIWEQAKMYPIDIPFKTETPTITATWQALYDNDNFYVLVTVEDENHWPGWQANGESTQYDMPEIFWDVNEVLDDGKGAKDVGSGHYRFSEGFKVDMYDIPTKKEAIGSSPGGTFAYSLIGDGYVYEISVPLVNLKDNLGNTLTPYTRRNIGFDVTVIDQDEGITTSPQRYVWSNDGEGNNGSTDESWNNLDGAGDIMLDYPGDFDGFVWLFPSTYAVTLPRDSGATSSFNVYTNMDWSAESDQSWMNVKQSTNSGDGIITIKVLENKGSTRTGIITIIWDNVLIPKITVTQLGDRVGIRSEIKNNRNFISNCVNGDFYFKSRIDKIQLFNSLGVLVKETTVKAKTVSVAELPNGVYIVKAYNNGQLLGVKKVIKK